MAEATTAAPRSWWRNCALEADAEILDIDRLEDQLAPLDPGVARIRELISTLELCHHKSERWIENIIEAVCRGDTAKGLGTRPPGHSNSVEEVWKSACAALSAWCAGSPSESVTLCVGALPASELLRRLGVRTALKEWQVQRVIEKIRSLIHWPSSSVDPAAQYVWILFSGGEYESLYRSKCPGYYKEHEEFWLATARTMIHDTENGDEAALSLGLAIDMLWPCHWRFVENLRIVLDAIGGRLNPDAPFAACGRNITLLPSRKHMEIVSGTLRAFCGVSGHDEGLDTELLAMLGEPAADKRWLAASLDKTIRLQLNPPAELRAVCALAGPEWIRQ